MQRKLTHLLTVCLELQKASVGLERLRSGICSLPWLFCLGKHVCLLLHKLLPLFNMDNLYCVAGKCQGCIKMETLNPFLGSFGAHHWGGCILPPLIILTSGMSFSCTWRILKLGECWVPDTMSTQSHQVPSVRTVTVLPHLAILFKTQEGNSVIKLK